ncbi:MAG: poly-gamma-glutamate biosynthesis protein PgsC [Bacteroidales bacterium]|nr:poly-gamma-glutamate biosynthesis protein PgsC [Bacteroidales bacterium]
MIIGFLFYEITGISPGGVIAPAYLALFIYDPAKIAMTLVISFLVFLIIRYLSRTTILYGRRKFLLAVLLSFVIKLLIENIIQPMDVITLDLQSIGYIIPGLIANEMSRQKVIPTLLGTGIVTLIVVLTSMLII